MMARYKKKYASQSMDFVIPLVALLFMGVMFVLLSSSQGSIGFIFLVVASGLVVYWVRELKTMSRSEDERLKASREEQKDWVYDLIKNNDEMVFVAEVPGPEEQINVKLAGGLLRIKGGQNFAREVPLEVSEMMGIADYKYRNGVLTIKIQKM